MKLLLINAVNTDNISETVFPNLGLGYIASFLRQQLKDIEIKIIDSDASGLQYYLKSFSPELVGISAVSQNFGYVKKICQDCRSLNIPVFVGGIHISSLPQSLPPEADVGVIGEGENTVLELVKVFRDGGFQEKSLSQVKGIVFRDNSGRLLQTPDRPLIENLDTLPFPARGLLKINKKSFLHLFTSRGCRFRCIFCSNSRFWKQVRFFSAEYIFAELEHVMEKHEPRAITFYDDDFLTSKERLIRLTSLIDSSGINKKTEFNLMTHVDSIDEETTRLLRKMNVTVVSLGLESGSQNTLNFLKGKTVTVEKNFKTVELLNKAGIFTYGFFIIGAPQETEDDIMQTYDFIRKSRLDGFSAYTLVPYPGTPIWEYAQKRGLVSEDMPWQRLTLNINEASDGVVVLSEKIPAKRLYELYWKFQKLRKRMHAAFMFKRALRNPALIIPRISRSIKYYFLREADSPG